jgi:hypothetical protein
MTVHSLFTAISAITKYDAAQHMKQKKAMNLGRKAAAVIVCAAALTAPLVFTSCEQPTSDEETPTVINKDYELLLTVSLGGSPVTVTIRVEGVPVDMDGKLASVFAEFESSLGSSHKAKIRSWAARAGAKIVILENPGFTYTQIDGVVLKINRQYLIDGTISGLFDVIFDDLIDIEEAQQLLGLGNQFDGSRKTVRVAFGKGIRGKQFS